eukprot:CAMPEP_0171467478 /NCGR_PEP_ID=MMETSP0945-20130129/9993_1 /TAXON_ID=109269 /ORGANISM="Vaucheria litorea, Strain CCMP2940" /LENGTH=150 /DNA_ID=CAMNT_0011995999 /DNA_START=85 /DNA_END=534 /DNA_ORIENTATION=-
MAELKVDIDGCKKTDKYGCSDFSTEWGKNLSGSVHAVLKNDLGKGSHFIASMHIKTGIFPIPFNLQCKLCGEPCKFKVPILDKEMEIKLPACPLKASSADKKFNVKIPTNDPIPLKLAVDGVINVYNEAGKEVAAVHVNVRTSKPSSVLY